MIKLVYISLATIHVTHISIHTSSTIFIASTTAEFYNSLGVLIASIFFILAVYLQTVQSTQVTELITIEDQSLSLNVNKNNNILKIWDEFNNKIIKLLSKYIPVCIVLTISTLIIYHAGNAYFSVFCAIFMFIDIIYISANIYIYCVYPSYLNNDTKNYYFWLTIYLILVFIACLLLYFILSNFLDIFIFLFKVLMMRLEDIFNPKSPRSPENPQPERPETSSDPQPEGSGGPSESTNPQPEGSSNPQPEGSSNSQPEGSSNPQPEGSSSPQPEGSSSPQPEGSGEPWDEYQKREIARKAKKKEIDQRYLNKPGIKLMKREREKIYKNIPENKARERIREREYRKTYRANKKIKDQKLREEQLREEQLKEQQLIEEQLREEQLREQQLIEEQLREKKRVD